MREEQFLELGEDELTLAIAEYPLQLEKSCDFVRRKTGARSDEAIQEVLQSHEASALVIYDSKRVVGLLVQNGKGLTQCLSHKLTEVLFAQAAPVERLEALARRELTRLLMERGRSCTTH